MNKFKCFFIGVLLLSFSVQAQSLNGNFEKWNKKEPVNWHTSNVYEETGGIKEEIWINITKDTSAHRGLYGAKGEVINVADEGEPPLMWRPYLKSGIVVSNKEVPYKNKPKQICGYYNFQSVGGDRFIVKAALGREVNGKNEIIAYSFVWQDTSTLPGYHELVMDLTYIDTINTPTFISLSFEIGTSQPGLQVHEGSVFYVDDFLCMSLLKPPGEPNPEKEVVFISGEVDTIKWESGGAQNVDLEYSEDDGVTYTNIVSNYPADSNRYFWKVPKTLLSRKGKIRIIDSQDKKNKEESIRFNFKPWQLTRIKSDDKFALFEPNKHGWSYPNDSSFVWPLSWWQQFNYQSGNDPHIGKKYPNSAPFSSANSSDHPDWSIFVDVFEKKQCYINNNYNSVATTIWNGAKSAWGGSCYGFATSSIIEFYYPSILTDKFPGIGNINDLYNVPLSDGSRKAINHYYTHQFGKEALQNDNLHNNDTPRQLLQQLKIMFRKENGDGKALSFFGNGAHTVVPYKLERIGKTSTFKLRLYDSNAPGSTNQIIIIDSTANTWTDQTGLGWGSPSSCYLEPNSIEFLYRPTLNAVQSRSKLNKQSSLSSTRLTIYNTSDAEINIISSSNEEIGYKDSVSFNSISNAIPIIPKIGRPHPPIGYYLPSDNYSLQMNKFTDSLSYVFFMTDSTIYNYRRFNSLNNESDILNYSENGVGIINPDQINKSIDMESIIIQDSTSEKVFVTSNIEVSANDSIHIREKDRSKLLLQNYGESSKYDLQIRIVSAKGQSIFNRAEILLPKNSSHQIVPTWENLKEDPVNILIDNGNDGTFDDSLIVTNEVTGIEKNNYVGIPKEYKLLQNYPNPFNPSTTISFELPQKSEVNLTIYNTLGQVVATLINEVKQAGQHQIVFDASHLPNGVYIYRIKAGSYSAAKKMILLK